jgi:hypothetical protein
MKKPLFAILVMLSTPALAQQPPDPAFLQQAIVAIQAQRNEALDKAAGAQAQVALLSEQITKLRERVKELEAKYEPKPDGK